MFNNNGSSATKHHSVKSAYQAVLVGDERSKAIPMSGSGNILFLKLSNKGGNPEYSDHQKYGPIAYGVGEIPLNEKGIVANVSLIIGGVVIKKWSNLM